MRPLLLDLFCCEGGAATGYYRAGFDIIGVDIDPQPRYPFPFIQGDALELLGNRYFLNRLRPAAIHASPPCQLYSMATVMHDRSVYPDLVEPTRNLLMETRLPWVIENVPGAPLVEVGSMTFDGRSAIMLCGSMFGMRRVRRHRIFETNWGLTSTMRCRHEEQSDVMSIVGHSEQGRSGHTGPLWNVDARRDAMGMPWATRDGLSEAIPPAYTEHIGTQLLNHLTTDKENR